MEENQIVLKRRIAYFYANSTESFERFAVGSVVLFPLTQKHIIRIENDVHFSFQFDTFNTKTFRLSVADFRYIGLSLELLDEVANKFDLVKKAGLKPEYFSLCFEKYPDFETAMISFQRKDSKIFIIVLSSRKEREATSAAQDFYSNNIFYINDIWEVAISKELELIIFKEINSNI